MIQMLLPSVINSPVKVYLPKIVRQNGMIHYVPVIVNKTLVQVCLPTGVSKMPRVLKSLIQVCLANSIARMK
jgi:hypothetical protein